MPVADHKTTTTGSQSAALAPSFAPWAVHHHAAHKHTPPQRTSCIQRKRAARRGPNPCGAAVSWTAVDRDRLGHWLVIHAARFLCVCVCGSIIHKSELSDSPHHARRRKHAQPRATTGKGEPLKHTRGFNVRGAVTTYQMTSPILCALCLKLLNLPLLLQRRRLNDCQRPMGPPKHAPEASAGLIRPLHLSFNASRRLGIHASNQKSVTAQTELAEASGRGWLHDGPAGRPPRLPQPFRSHQHIQQADGDVF